MAKYTKKDILDMSFDECIPYPVEYQYAKDSTERTLRWAERGLKAHVREDQALFGIVQGGAFTDLREMCAQKLEIGRASCRERV